jgi:protease IV
MDNQIPPPLPPSAPSQLPIFVTAPQPRRGGRGWMVLSLVLLAIIGLMMVGRMASFVMGGGKHMTGTQSGHYFEEVTVENPGGQDKIVVVPVEGMITSAPWDPAGRSMVDMIEDQLKLAAKDSDVKAVILKVDSPGGEVLASDDISRAIIQFQEKNKKPVIASMGGLAASGGYYVSAPCDYIVANELTLTGSIGVIMSTFNYRGLMDKVGLKPNVFKSGKFKDMLRGSKLPEEIDPAEEKMIQDMIMETYGKFKSVVKNGREKAAKQNKAAGKALVANWEEYADGRILTGKTAYDLGFVDKLGNFQTALDIARQIGGVSGQAHVVRYQEPFTLSRLLGFGASSGAKRSKSDAVKIDLGLDLPKVEAGRMYFLAPTVIP